MMGNPNWGTINLHLGEVSSFDFYVSYMLLLKSPVLMRSCWKIYFLQSTDFHCIQVHILAVLKVPTQPKTNPSADCFHYHVWGRKGFPAHYTGSDVRTG